MSEEEKEQFYQEAEKEGFWSGEPHWHQPPMIDIFSVTVATIESNSLSIPIMIENARENETVETLALIDSRAGGKFIDQKYVETTGLETHMLKKPIMAQNVDGTENKCGRITSFVKLNLIINGRKNRTRLLVTGLGKQKIILGFPWLNEHNPKIDWKTGKFTWQTRDRIKWPLKIKQFYDTMRSPVQVNQVTPKTTMVEEPDEDENLNRTQNPTEDDILLAYLEEVQWPNDIWINAKTSPAIEFHLKHDEKREDLPLD